MDRTPITGGAGASFRQRKGVGARYGREEEGRSQECLGEGARSQKEQNRATGNSYLGLLHDSPILGRGDVYSIRACTVHTYNLRKIKTKKYPLLVDNRREEEEEEEGEEE